MYFVDFISMDQNGRPIDMTINLRAQDLNAAIEEAKKLKSFTGSTSGQVYSLDDEVGFTHSKVVAIIDGVFTSTHFAAGDINVFEHLNDIMNRGGIFLPTRFIMAEV